MRAWVAHRFCFQPLCRRAGAAWGGLAVFLASGLLHDVVLSLPAGAGYGLPTAYFLLQGIAVMVERSAWGKRMGLGEGLRGWLFMAAVTAGPAFWLFHPPFVTRVIVPFLAEIGAG